jgi:hypothetical protein
MRESLSLPRIALRIAHRFEFALSTERSQRRLSPGTAALAKSSQLDQWR